MIISTRATPRRGHARRSKSVVDIHILCNSFTADEYHENFDLKIRVKITEYNIRNGPIFLHISNSIKEVLEHFSLSLEIFHFEIRDLENVDKGHDAAAPYDDKYLPSYLI